MKKIIFIVVAVMLFQELVIAQKYAFVDSEYILENIPAFTAAQEQLDQFSSQYQKELESMHAEIEQMYNDFQAESVFFQKI